MFCWNCGLSSTMWKPCSGRQLCDNCYGSKQATEPVWCWLGCWSGYQMNINSQAPCQLSWGGRLGGELHEDRQPGELLSFNTSALQWGDGSVSRLVPLTWSSSLTLLLAACPKFLLQLAISKMTGLSISKLEIHLNLPSSPFSCLDGLKWDSTGSKGCPTYNDYFLRLSLTAPLCVKCKNPFFFF